MSQVRRPVSTQTRLTPLPIRKGLPSETGRGKPLSEVQMMKRAIDEFGRRGSVNPSHQLRLQRIKANHMLAKREKERRSPNHRRNTCSLKKRSDLTETTQEENLYRAEEPLSYAVTLQPQECLPLNTTEGPLETEKSRNENMKAVSFAEVEERLVGERNKGIKWRIQKNRNARREPVSSATTRATSLSSQTELPQLYTSYYHQFHNPPISESKDIERLKQIRDGKSLRQIEIQSLKRELVCPPTPSRNENKFYRREKQQTIFSSVAPSLHSMRSKRTSEFKLFNFNKSSFHCQPDMPRSEDSKPLSGVLYKSVRFSKIKPSDGESNSLKMTNSMVDLQNERSTQSHSRKQARLLGSPSPRPRFLLTNVEDIRSMIASEFERQGVSATRKVIAWRKLKAVNKGFVAFVRPECFKKQVMREKLWTEEVN